MNFEKFILEQYKSLGVLKEAPIIDNSTDTRKTNVISSTFKNIGHILKGGKEPGKIEIVLKSPKDIEKLKTLLEPPYEQASERVKQAEKDKVDANLEDQISVNCIEVLQGRAIGQYELSLTLNDLVTGKGRFGTARSGEIGKQKVSFQQIVDTAQRVLKKAIDAKVIEWNEEKELSPKDLFNRFVNKATGVVGQTAKELVSSDTGINKG